MPANRHDNDGLRKLCGCSRRKWAKCSHPWHFNFACKGAHFRFTLDRLVGAIEPNPKKPGQWQRANLGARIRNKTDAQREATRLRAGIEDGSLLPGPDGPVLATLTLSQLLTMYDTKYLTERRAARSNGLQNARYQIEAIKRVSLTLPSGVARAFGDWFVSDIGTGTLEDFRTVRRAAGVVAANRNLALLRHVFNWPFSARTLSEPRSSAGR